MSHYVTIDEKEHGEDVTGNELFVRWLGPWVLRRTFTGHRWVRPYGEYGYRFGTCRLHKGPRV